MGAELFPGNGALRLVKGAQAMALGYDESGNMTSRVREGEGQVLTYDAENRLVKVEKSGATLAEFVYGPGGERVKGTVGANPAVTTVYVGNHYEVQGGTIRKYYYAGAQRVAMREGNALYWLLTDHLGSTAMTANADGSFKAEVRYKAWGEERYTNGTTPTTYRYTGQRAEAGIGLYYYNARWYDPALGRFISPDTLVPSPADPQSLNRFAYVRNNPLVHVDPSGNRPLDEETLTHASPYWTLEEEEEALWQEAVAEASAYYCANFDQPFEGTPSITDPFGSPRPYGQHHGVDYGGSFSVFAPYDGVVTYAGSSGEAGIWKVGKPVLDESGQVVHEDVHEWSHRHGPMLRTSDKKDGLYEPERLLAAGYVDMEPTWSHVEGTLVRISHGHGLETIYEHLDSVGSMTVSRGQVVSKGQRIGDTNNNGWSTGAHLHYGVRFTWVGRSEWLNPAMCTP